MVRIKERESKDDVFCLGFINARTRTFSSNSLDMESISSIGDSVTISWRHTVKVFILNFYHFVPLRDISM